MTADKAIEILKQFNAWRKEETEHYPGSHEIGEAIDYLVDTFENKGPY